MGFDVTFHPVSLGEHILGGVLYAGYFGAIPLIAVLVLFVRGLMRLRT